MDQISFTQRRVRLFLRGYLGLQHIFTDNWPRSWASCTPYSLDEYDRALVDTRLRRGR